MKNKIIYLILFILAIVFVGYLLMKNKATHNPTTTINSNSIKENEFRKYRTVIILDSVSLIGEPGKFEFFNDTCFLFYKIPDNGFYIWDINNKKQIDKFHDSEFVQNIKANGNAIYSIVKYSNNTKLGKYYEISKWVNNQKEVLVSNISKGSSIIHFLNFNKIYYKINNDENQQIIQIVDIFDSNKNFVLNLENNLNEIIKNDEFKEFINTAYHGYLIEIDSNNYLYKLEFASYGLLYNKPTNKYQIVQTIDSLPMPPIVTTNHDNGMKITRIDDSKYKLMYIRFINDDFYLIEINMIENKHLVSKYDKNFVFQYSIDVSKYNFYPCDLQLKIVNGIEYMYLLSAQNNKYYKMKINNDN